MAGTWFDNMRDAEPEGAEDLATPQVGHLADWLLRKGRFRAGVKRAPTKALDQRAYGAMSIA